MSAQRYVFYQVDDAAGRWHPGGEFTNRVVNAFEGLRVYLFDEAGDATFYGADDGVTAPNPWGLVNTGAKGAPRYISVVFPLAASESAYREKLEGFAQEAGFTFEFRGDCTWDFDINNWTRADPPVP